MTPAEIKVKRTESILEELIPEGLSELSDSRLRLLEVLEVKCSKGRSDAKVYLDPSDYTPEEQEVLIRLVIKARPIIENYCLKDQGWFKSPQLTFAFDDTYEKGKRLDELFDQISKR